VRLIFSERSGENVLIIAKYAESLFQNLDQNVSHTFLVKEDILAFAITSEILRFYAL